jgi:hypothetical protein
MAGVLDATVSQFRAHPYVWGGLALGVVALVWLLSGSSKSSAAPSSFSFSTGPSDTQLNDQTALAIAQLQAQTQSALATGQFQAQTTQAADYYQYLATASANQLAATGVNDTAAFNIAQAQANAGVVENNQDTNAQAYIAQAADNAGLGSASLQAIYSLDQNQQNTNAETNIANLLAAWHSTQNSYG